MLRCIFTKYTLSGRPGGYPDDDFRKKKKKKKKKKLEWEEHFEECRLSYYIIWNARMLVRWSGKVSFKTFFLILLDVADMLLTGRMVYVKPSTLNTLKLMFLLSETIIQNIRL